MKASKLVITLLSALLSAGWAGAADTVAPPQKQTVCPVMGGKVNTNLFVDAEGKRIYVCCKGCLGDLKSDPAKYIAQLEAKGVKLDVAPKPAADAKK